MKLAELLEALKPSQYRSLVKGWDKSKYAKIFKKYASDKKAYRIYIPLKGDAERISAPSAIAKAIADAGYEIEDYATGIASKDDGKRKVKIGKLLKDPELLKQFAEDPKRGGAKRSDYVVVISRHPYDLGGMSTDRGWTSCMNLEDGENMHYVPLDVKGGTLVAYLIKSDDKNISAPVARVLIKPFTNKKKVALGIEDQVYGTNVAGFTRTVKEWVGEINGGELDGVFTMKRGLYRDGHGALLYMGGTDVSQFANNPEKIAGANLTDKQMIAIMDFLAQEEGHSLTGKALRYFPDTVSTQVQLAMVRSFGGHNAIQHIKDPSEAVQLAAVEDMAGLAIKYIKDPSEAVQLAAIKINPYMIANIKNPTEAVQLAVVERRPDFLGAFNNPSEKVKAAAKAAEERKKAK